MSKLENMICCICEEEPANIDLGPSPDGEMCPVCEHCLKIQFDQFFAPSEPLAN